MAPQNDHDTEKAARRLEQILAVMRGEKSATLAAEALDVSRETFYEWNNRALAGLRESLADRDAGRPPTPPENLEKTQLKTKQYVRYQEAAPPFLWAGLAFVLLPLAAAGLKATAEP